MDLEQIGFYTLNNHRAANCNLTSPLWRCELILTDACNFKCPYCRGLRHDCAGTMPLIQAKSIVQYWINNGLKNVRFSGGEPTLYKGLSQLVRMSKAGGVEHIAISTNGSQDINKYLSLAEDGVNDFSISLDACCSSFGKKMSGGVEGVWERVIENIEILSAFTYVTVGVVFTEDNVGQAKEIVELAHSLGVADIRVISAAQYNEAIRGLSGLSDEILDAHPILKYRVNNFLGGRNVRGIKPQDGKKCFIVIDDMAVAGGFHFPCVIYMREGGDPIGKFEGDVRRQRVEWAKSHNCYEDPICRESCLDCLIDANNHSRKYNHFFDDK